MRVFLAGVLAGVLVVLLTGFRAQPEPEQAVEVSAAASPTAVATADVAASAAGVVRSPDPVTPPEPTPTPEPPCRPELSLAQRAGQVLVVGLPEVTSPDDPLVAEVTEAGVGGVFLTGYNIESTDQVAALIDALTAEDLPPLVATDEEGGRVSSFRDLFGSTSSPRTMASRGDSTEAVRAFATDLGSRLADVGVTLDFAPVADLDDGASNGIIGDRSFSADPAAASAYVTAFAEGLVDGGVLPTVKHFPGHGASTQDPHRKDVAVDASLEQLRAGDLVPFVEQIERGAPVMMMSHVTYPAIDGDFPASMSRQAYRLLRELGFQGVAVTDSIGMGAVHKRWDFPEAAVQAVTAGADAVLATDGNQAVRMRDALVEAVRDGRLSEARLDQAAARMLRLKGIDPAPLVCSDPAFPERMVRRAQTMRIR